MDEQPIFRMDDVIGVAINSVVASDTNAVMRRATTNKYICSLLGFVDDDDKRENEEGYAGFPYSLVAAEYLKAVLPVLNQLDAQTLFEGSISVEDWLKKEKERLDLKEETQIPIDPKYEHPGLHMDCCNTHEEAYSPTPSRPGFVSRIRSIFTSRGIS